MSPKIKVNPAIATGILELFKKLRSPDRPTRRMSTLFWASVVGVVFVISFGIQHAMHVREQLRLSEAENDRQKHQIEEAMLKKQDDLKLDQRTISLGIFSLELKLPAGSKAKRGVYNMAEFEMIARCDSKETKAFVEEHMVQVRNQLTNGLTPMDREEFLSRDGKKALRKALVKRVNLWLDAAGRLEDVYISNLVVN